MVIFGIFNFACALLFALLLPWQAGQLDLAFYFLPFLHRKKQATLDWLINVVVDQWVAIDLQKSELFLNWNKPMS